jgi:Ca-activated chloride channel family protein
MNIDFLAPGRLWLLVIPAALAVLYVVVLRWRKTATVRFTQVDLLDRVAPNRPRWRRHVVAGQFARAHRR